MELLAPTAFASRLLCLRFLTTLSTILFVLLCLPVTGLGQTCDAPFCGTLDAQAATSQPQTITFNGTNLPGTGGQVVCLAGPTVNNGGSATGASNDTTFTLNVLNANAAFYQTYNSRLTLDLNWTPASGDPTTSDLELLFDSFDNQSDNNGPHEQLIIDNVGSGEHTLYVCNMVVAAQQPFTITAKLEVRSVNSPFPPPALPPLAPLANVTPPRYQNHTPRFEQIAAGMSKNASDEPSIGVNWNTGAVFFQGVLQTLRVGFDDTCTQTPSSAWVDKSPLTSKQTFDPILFTDSRTGATVVSQLGFNPVVGLSSVTFDDGETWIPSNGAGIGSGIDHQTVGGGAYHIPAPPNAVTGRAVYYCSQDIALANCALSVDGGITYGPSVPIYALTQCGGLHGHVKVAPDGTVVVPNRGCKGATGLEQAVVVSENNGTTWTVRTVPSTVASGSDPSVAFDNAGRLYLGYTHSGVPATSVSEDKGLNWKHLYDVGSRLGIKNAAFPAVTAGDAGRAAFAFYGTAAGGNVNDFASPPMAWHLYVAHTYDGGQSWVTVDATPNDALQRGGIHLGGGGSIHRNLLDFFDATTDAQGRVLVGYADGCRGTCSQSADSARGNSYGAFSTIARQSGGPRLIGTFDPPAMSVPGAPRLTVTRNGALTKLTWSQSDNGGLAISVYKVYRRLEGGTEQLLANVAGSATSYVDQSADPRRTYSYRVAASNSLGASCGTNETPAPPVGSSCSAPGWRVLQDASGDQLGAPTNTDMDIEWVSVAEPYFTDGSRKLVFRLKVASLASLQPNRMWRIVWNYPDAPAAGQPGADGSGFAGRYYVGMDTDESGVASFSYGFLGVDTTAVLVDLAPPLPLGVPDQAEFSPDGTITFTIAADKVGNPKAGDLIGGILARAWPAPNDVTMRSDSAADSVTLGLTYGVVGNAFCQNPRAVITCFEDDDAHISYASGWHLVSSSGASAGHFRYHTGNPSNGMRFTFDVTGSSGALVYHYAKAKEDGLADVYIDNVYKGTINYEGSSGSGKKPQFGFNIRYAGLAPGSHVFELRNIRGFAFVDRFCLEDSALNSAMPSTGPGNTSSVLDTLAPLTDLVQTVQAPLGTQAISVYAESSNGSPVRLLLLDPLGGTVSTVTSNTGRASIDVPVSLPGAYVVRVANVGTAPSEVWLLATPWGSR